MKWVVGCGLWVVGMAIAAWPQVAEQHHPPRSAEEYARVLNDPQRDGWQKPHEVLAALALKPGEVIADLGAGTGYFARRFAGHAAKVYAIDIDEELLKRVRAGAPANLEAILAAPDDPRLPEASVDTIFICDTLHHIANRAAYYPKLRWALKPGGRIALAEFRLEDRNVPIKLLHKMSKRQILKEFPANGLKLASEFDELPWQHLMFFERDETGKWADKP